MNVLKYYCHLPRTILDRAGAILCLPTGSVPEVGRSDRVWHALLCALREDPALLLVMHSGNHGEGPIETARLRMPENMRCRVIGSITGIRNAEAQVACENWRNLYAPKLPFAVLDASMEQKIAMMDGNHGSRRARQVLAARIRTVVGLPNTPISIGPLSDPELVALSVETYAHGLWAFSSALIQPLLDQAGLSESSDNRSFSYKLIHGRTSADRLGELCRSLNIRLRVNFDFTECLSENHLSDQLGKSP